MTIDIATLSKAEKARLYADLAFERQMEGKSTKRSASDGDLTTFESMVWNAACVATSASPASLGVFFDQFGKKHFQAAAAEIELFLDVAAPGARMPTQTAVLRLCFESLVRYLTRFDAAPTPKSVFANVNKLKHVVDRAYPGYADCGMLGRIAIIA